MNDSSGPALSLIMYFIKPADYLNEALASIVKQLTPAVELIVVAGHQPNEELGIDPAYRARIDRLIVEPDSGGWDAANKGLRAARGTWVQLAMSDDILPDGSIGDTLAALSGSDADLACGKLIFFDASGQETLGNRSNDFSLDRVLGHLAAPAFVYRRALLNRLGGFDGSFRYSHDRELLLRAWCAGARFVALPHTTYRMRVHRDSRTTSGNAKVATSCQVEHVAYADRALRDAALAPADMDKLRRWRDEELIKYWVTKAYAALTPQSVAAPPNASLPLRRLLPALARVAGRKLVRSIRNPASTLDPPGRFRVDN